MLSLLGNKIFKKGRMIIIETKNYKEMSLRTAEVLIDLINPNSKTVIGFATGETPIGMYKELIMFYKTKKVDFSNVISFNLDEYYLISKKDKKSFYYYMHRNLFNHVNIRKSNINFLNGEADNWKKECLEYEKKIGKNPIDVQILGVGRNGHIAFDEPGSSMSSHTRIVKLTDETKRINNVNYSFALSVGISTIMKSKKIILLASGKEKAKAIKHLVYGKIDRKWPVSYLRKHKNLIVIIDKDAGRLLR